MGKRKNDAELSAVRFYIDQAKNLPVEGQREVIKALQGGLAVEVPLPDRVVSMAETAKTLGRTKRTVNALIKEGLLVPVRPDGRQRSWGVTGRSLEAFIRNGGRKATKEDDAKDNRNT